MENQPPQNLAQTPPQLEKLINFLPPLTSKNLPYIEESTNLYANLYKIIITTPLILYEYAIKFADDLPEISTRVKRKVILKINKEITEKYGIFIYNGMSLFCSKKIKEVVQKEVIVNAFKYTFSIHPTTEIIELTTDMDKLFLLYQQKPEVKTILEIIIKDILSHNPSLRYIKNLYGKKTEEKIISASDEYNSIKIMPGFITKVMFFENGVFLNVDIKNKIVSSHNCLYLLSTFIRKPGAPTKEEIKEINDFFSGRTVETIHTGQRFKIASINFERKVKNYEVPFENKTIPISKFYKKIFDLTLEPDSPLILIENKKKKTTDPNSIGRYFPPELCLLVGLTEEMVKDSYLVKNMVKKIKMTPDDKVSSIKDIMKLINEKKSLIIKRKNEDGTIYEEKQKSCYEKKIEYGIDLIDLTNESFFTGGVMKDPKIYGHNNVQIKSLMKPFSLTYPKEINMLLVYHKFNEQDKKNLLNLFKTAGKSYNICFGRMEYQHLNSEYPKDWINTIISSYRTNRYNIIVILIDDYLKGIGLYDAIKYNAIEEVGYNTQFIVTSSLRKNALSVVSNILIQMNTKIGGLSYSIDFSNTIGKKKLMIVGVDSSYFTENKIMYIKLAICSTINDTFTQYHNQKIILPEDYGQKISFNLNNYIYYSLIEYFKINRMFPQGVIIYRQGVSKEQKQYLSHEIEEINKLMIGESELLKDINIPYYYILVNKKTTLKFFETSRGNRRPYKERNERNLYDNPEPGLLVYQKIVDPMIYEFYIQPQKVSSGTATPSNFHVAYGNMNCPEMIPKLTYDLCFLYSNWRGPIRIPAPLKYAEKLAKVPQGLNEAIKNNLAYI